MTNTDTDPLQVGTKEIECVKEFAYLGMVMASSGPEVMKRIAQASRAFEPLRRAIFKDRSLTIRTKRSIYEACVVSVYCCMDQKAGRHYANISGNWIYSTTDEMSPYNPWHHQSTAVGPTPNLSCSDRLWGDTELLSRRVTKRRLEWLGHVVRMPDHCIPKQMLFEWLPQPCPPGGPRRRWRDLIRKDLRSV